MRKDSFNSEQKDNAKGNMEKAVGLVFVSELEARLGVGVALSFWPTI